jgi:hypothetical protein
MKDVKPASDRETSLADSYARWRARRLGRITDALEARLLVEIIDPKPGLRVLDVGRGDSSSPSISPGAAPTSLGSMRTRPCWRRRGRNPRAWTPISFQVALRIRRFPMRRSIA